MTLDSLEKSKKLRHRSKKKTVRNLEDHFKDHGKIIQQSCEQDIQAKLLPERSLFNATVIVNIANKFPQVSPYEE